MTAAVSATAARAYGIALRLHDLPGIRGLVALTEDPVDVPTHVRVVPTHALNEWAAATAPVRMRELWHQGELLMTIDHAGSRGYLVETPFHGRFTVSADGEEVLCAPLAEAGRSWHGLLLGQVLPLAATLRGLEVFHAGAIAVGNRASLICAQSGVGKSTLVACLIAGGATLVADDAVAVDLAGGELRAHPGPPVLHLFPDAAASLDGNGRLQAVGSDRAKLALAAPSSAEPLPIRALYLLERGEPGSGPRIDEGSVQATELLASTMTRAVQTPARLLRQLDVCAALAAKVPVRRLTAGGPPGPAAVALLEDLCRS